jgi:hypothetical protein
LVCIAAVVLLTMRWLSGALGGEDGVLIVRQLHADAVEENDLVTDIEIVDASGAVVARDRLRTRQQVEQTIVSTELEPGVYELRASQNSCGYACRMGSWLRDLLGAPDRGAGTGAYPCRLSFTIEAGQTTQVRAVNDSLREGPSCELVLAPPRSAASRRTGVGNSSPTGREPFGRAATASLAADSRVAFYMGDDERVDYVYKFVTAGRFVDGAAAGNGDLLDEGTLYVARFDVDPVGNRVGTWIPMVDGEGALTADNGFASQAECS